MGNGTANEDESVAVVGMSCRLPGGISSPEALWALLENGGELTGPVPASRLGAGQDIGVVVAAEPPGLYFEAAELTGLDLDFFGLSPREAARIEPQHRLLMELSWEAIEDAGFVPGRATESVGVFVGIWNVDEPDRSEDGPLDLYGVMGRGRHAASGRLSHLFGFDGPSLTVDSACSSSLVALHLAANAIRSGECEVAVVGAANVILDDRITTAFADAGMLSPDGRSRFGDASANGFVRAEGAAALVLRRHDRALAANDRIHAVLEGSAISNDGRATRHLVTPGPTGQRQAAELALARAGLDGGDLTYVEAHGTGTAGGDAAELTALVDLLAGDRTPCLVGSIKSNLGHTEGAAGLFGVVKAALMFRHRVIPPTLHVEQPRPDIDWDRAPIRLAVASEPMEAGDDVRIGVANFGLSGTNAHAVLAPPSSPGSVAPAPNRSPLLPITARSKAALAARATQLADRIEADPDGLASIAATARTRRSHHSHRAVAIGHEPEAVVAALRAAAGDNTDPNLVTGRVTVELSSGGPESVPFVDVVSDNEDAAEHRLTADRFVAGEPVAWSDRSMPVTLPAYPWQRRRTWSVGSSDADGLDRDPGRRLPQLAHRPDDNVWERTWAESSLAELLTDPIGLPALVVTAAGQLQDVTWSATVADADLASLQPTGGSAPVGRSAEKAPSWHRTQLLVINGPDPRFEFFVASGAGWAALANGALERVDGYPLPAPVGDAIDRLPPGQRHRWLAKRIGEQVAITLGRPPASPIDPTIDLVGLGADDALVRTIGIRLNALLDDRQTATTVDGGATIESITDRILADRTNDAEPPVRPGSDPGPGPNRTETSTETTRRLADELTALLDGPERSARR